MTVRMRHTKGHSGNRRSHHAISGERISTDQKTGVTHLRHRACAVTGKYRGRQVIDVETRKARRNTRVASVSGNGPQSTEKTSK